MALPAEPIAPERLSCAMATAVIPAGTRAPLGGIFREGSRRRKRKWHVEGPVEAPVSKCRRFWKLLISAIHKAEELRPPLLGRYWGASGCGSRPAPERPAENRRRLPGEPLRAAAVPGKPGRAVTEEQSDPAGAARSGRRTRTQTRGGGAPPASHVGGGAGRGLPELLHRGGPGRGHRDHRQRIQRPVHPVSGTAGRGARARGREGARSGLRREGLLGACWPGERADGARCRGPRGAAEWTPAHGLVMVSEPVKATPGATRGRDLNRPGPSLGAGQRPSPRLVSQRSCSCAPAPPPPHLAARRAPPSGFFRLMKLETSWKLPEPVRPACWRRSHSSSR